MSFRESDRVDFDLLFRGVSFPLAEHHNEPIMREIGGTDIVGETGLLRDALSGVAQAASRAMDAADPEQSRFTRSLRKRP